ncbi:helix-turn-helix transcriptional regulator [Endozoicomonas sp. Mp262]|uniref:response regulator transcription factor n=1 Tax=Endozoicomonas sp. Mp262 TaxID=2919499 RepID=UPI0021D9AE02
MTGEYTTARLAARYNSILRNRETEALALAAEGKTREETAIIMGISPETVKAHWSRAMKAMDATNRANLIALAFCNNILRPLLVLLMITQAAGFEHMPTRPVRTRTVPRTMRISRRGRSIREMTVIKATQISVTA